MSKAGRLKNRTRERKVAVTTLPPREQTSTNKFLGQQLDTRSFGEKIADRVAEQRGKDDKISRMLREGAVEEVDADGETLTFEERALLAGALARSGTLVVAAEQQPSEPQMITSEQLAQSIDAADGVLDFGPEDAIGIKVPGEPVVMSNDSVEISILANNDESYEGLTKEKAERQRKDEKNRKVREARALKRLQQIAHGEQMT